MKEIEAVKKPNRKFGAEELNKSDEECNRKHWK